MRGCLGTGMYRTRRLGTPAAGADRTRPAVPPARRPGPRRSSPRTPGQRQIGLAYLRDRTLGGDGGGGSHLYFDRATPDSTPGSDMPPSRRRHQSRRTCSSAQQGRVRRRVKCRQRTTSATAARKRTVYGRSRSLCRAPPRGRGATSHHVVHWRDQMSTDARNSSRLTSARCLQPITRWPARRSSSHASST